MCILRGKYVTYVYAVAFIFIEIIGSEAQQTTPIKCAQCGENGTLCKDDRSDAFTNCPTTAAFAKCFTKIDTDGKIIRGCLKPDDASSCTDANNCISTESAKNDQLVCKTCSGSDADCSLSEDTHSKFSKICDAGVTKCFKKIENGLVVRGCANETDVSKCTDKSSCQLCEAVNCNKLLNCYQCSGDKCNDVTVSTIFAKPCLVLQDNDQCYTKGDNETAMTRGCKSDKTDNKCSTAAEGCAFCSANACNDRKYKEKPTLKCYQCTGNSTNGDCFKAPAEAQLQQCEKEILYSQNQYCYTKIEGGQIERGCLSDSTSLTADTCKDAEGGACHKCTGDGCNNEEAQFTCIRCRSDENTDCWNNSKSMKGETCRNTNASPATGCYHGVWYGVAIRGCTVDASLQDQALCGEKGNPNNCEICYTKNCNVKESAGAKAGLSLALMSAILIRMTLGTFK